MSFSFFCFVLFCFGFVFSSYYLKCAESVFNSSYICLFINFFIFFSYLAQMLFGWNLTLENTTFSSILIRWTNLTNVLNRKVRHYIVFLNRRNNSVTLHQIVSGDQLTTELKGLTHSTNYSVEVVGIDTMGKPYKTPSEATKTANRKRGNAFVFFFIFVNLFFVLFCFVFLSISVKKSFKISHFSLFKGQE